MHERRGSAVLLLLAAATSVQVGASVAKSLFPELGPPGVVFLRLVFGSVALLADAGHVLSDVGAIALGLLAAAMAARPATGRRTFGFQRGEILAALVNGLLLVAVAVIVFVEAIGRLSASSRRRCARRRAISSGRAPVTPRRGRCLYRSPDGRRRASNSPVSSSRATRESTSRLSSSGSPASVLSRRS